MAPTATRQDARDAAPDALALLQRDHERVRLLFSELDSLRGVGLGYTQLLRVPFLYAIALMGLASTFIARVIHRYRWIAYVGLLVILYVSVEMIYEGYHEVRYGREAAHAEEVLESTDSELRQENGAEDAAEAVEEAPASE